MIVKKNKSSKSLSFTLIDKNKPIDLQKAYKFLKNKKKKISRICMHKNTKSNLHQMLIYQKKNYKSLIKFHPKKEKSYNLLKGKQNIYIYKKNGQLEKVVKLNLKDNFFFMEKNVIHSNETTSKDSFHIETIEGPLNNTDRIYIYEKK